MLDPPGHRRAIRQPESARELGGRPATWQLKQRQRVTPGLGHDPVTHPLIERTSHDTRQQLPRVPIVESDHGKFWQAIEESFAGRLAYGEHQPD